MPDLIGNDLFFDIFDIFNVAWVGIKPIVPRGCNYDI